MADDNKRSVPSLWSSDPFADFRSRMDHLFEDFFGDSRGMSPASASREAMPFLSPAIEVKESEKAITLTAELPGLSEEDVELGIRDGVLTLKGEKKYETEEEEEDRHFSERRYGSFQRTMTLPDRVDEAAITAKFDKGVLRVTMPKRAESMPAARKIEIGK